MVLRTELQTAATISSAAKLVDVLQHLHIFKVHVVTSEFAIPRVKMCFDGVLGAVQHAQFSVSYHSASDAMSPAERAARDVTEQNLIARSKKLLDQTIQQVKSHTKAKGNGSVLRTSTVKRQQMDLV
jgi:hypothetical protein